jgi:type II secretory ATPase GspE/PulE/Tfp pilus assembly ATPase PilB-like protein
MEASDNARAQALRQQRLNAATSPAMRLLDRYLAIAVDAGASDLHLEPGVAGLAVRMRVDGVLRTLEGPPENVADALLMRARLLARVDLAERRLPQDGRFVFEHAAGNVDVRAAFMPVHRGERLALRMMQSETKLTVFDDLGLEPPDREVFGRALERPHGLVAVVGPTGSGKTTTLYAALARLRRPQLSLMTVEDPVERELPGIAQIAVDEDCGRTFAAVLRAILRQDPDVIMVGEMRDPDSARIACRAALTGHRVLTTLHTADTREAVLRLSDLEIPDYLIRATLSLVIAQRLVRRLCTVCGGAAPARAAEAALFRALGMDAPASVGRARGCDTCGGEGYRGRRAVFELLPMIDAGGGSRGEVKVTPRRYLLQEGLRLAAAGATTFEEVVSVCPEPNR